jgi:ubiquitin C-terminal hydrolase
LVEAERNIAIAALPPFLTIHLNRSTFDGQGKIRHHVQVPFRLCLAPWTTADCTQRDAMYELTAIVFHSGHSSRSGHYIVAGRGDVLTKPLAQSTRAAAPSKSAAAPMFVDDDDDEDGRQQRLRDMARAQGELAALAAGDATRWFVFDDAIVTRSSERELQRLMAPGSASPATAYLLFYSRVA